MGWKNCVLDHDKKKMSNNWRKIPDFFPIIGMDDFCTTYIILEYFLGISGVDKISTRRGEGKYKIWPKQTNNNGDLKLSNNHVKTIGGRSSVLQENKIKTDKNEIFARI